MSQPEKSTTANTPTSIPATPTYSNEETLKVPFSVVKDQVHTDKKLAIPKMSQPIDVESSKILGKAYKKITNHRAIPTNLQLEIVEDTVAILLLYSVVIYTCMFSLSDSSTSSNM
ncbi:hypothetical protein EB796_006711 [Bugula neritina]|uniref:Uncharacterized protein n=1 Tax=Bugula neritina TaxID=10212 RepID=A0A7J7KBP5_BUGNE|nr:hypothetical protein EB796_006711 [Bugula neritina]